MKETKSSKTYQSISIIHEDGENQLNNQETISVAGEEGGSSSSVMTKLKKSPGIMAFLGAWCGIVLVFGVNPGAMSVMRYWRFLQGNTIKMCVKEMILVTPRNSQGAKVECWDKDSNADDKMCDGITGADGCVVMPYKNQNWDNWLIGENPDIFCSVDKPGWVRNVPEPKNHHDQGNQAVFSATLYRDRKEDYGATNGCGPEITKWIANGAVTWATGFGDQCFQHDKCYWDCQIFDAAGQDAEVAQKFCDDEMKAGMDSLCYYEWGDLGLGSDSVCLATSASIRAGLGAVGGIVAYDKTPEECAQNRESYENVYPVPQFASSELVLR